MHGEYSLAENHLKKAAVCDFKTMKKIFNEHGCMKYQKVVGGEEISQKILVRDWKNNYKAVIVENLLQQGKYFYAEKKYCNAAICIDNAMLLNSKKFICSVND